MKAVVFGGKGGPEVVELAEVDWAWFDPRAGRYRTVRLPPVRLQAGPPSAVPGASVAESAEWAALLRPLRTEGTPLPRREPPWRDGGFLALLLLGPLAFAGLALGAWGLFAGKRRPRLRLVIGLVLAGQLVLHLLYGDETFLYALHYLPFLVLLAACGALTKARPVVLILALLLTVGTAANNLVEFRRIIGLITPTERERTLGSSNEFLLSHRKHPTWGVQDRRLPEVRQRPQWAPV